MTTIYEATTPDELRAAVVALCVASLELWHDNNDWIADAAERTVPPVPVAWREITVAGGGEYRCVDGVLQVKHWMNYGTEFWWEPCAQINVSALDALVDLRVNPYAARTFATQRAVAAEADARSAWVEYAGEKETSAQRLCYLRQSDDMVDALTAERDALRKAVRTHVETVSKNIHHESGCPWFDNRKRCACGTQPAADALRQLLDAALAVQP